MSDVDRYDNNPDNDEDPMGRSEYGEWVMYDDYQSLQQQLEAAEKENRDMRRIADLNDYTQIQYNYPPLSGEQDIDD
jgi:hypothetical protein